MTLVARGAFAASAIATVMALAACTSDASTATQDEPTQAPAEDFGTRMARCMTEKGWDVEVSADGGYGTSESIPEEQNDRYTADEDECAHRFGYDQTPQPLSVEEAEELYDVFLEVGECVRGMGFGVPDPPSKQSFVDKMARDPIPPWHPYDGVANPDDYQRVSEQCPIPQ